MKYIIISLFFLLTSCSQKGFDYYCQSKHITENEKNFRFNLEKKAIHFFRTNKVDWNSSAYYFLITKKGKSQYDVQHLFGSKPNIEVLSTTIENLCNERKPLILSNKKSLFPIVFCRESAEKKDKLKWTEHKKKLKQAKALYPSITILDATCIMLYDK